MTPTPDSTRDEIEKLRQQIALMNTYSPVDEIRRLSDKISELAIGIQALNSSMMPRAEIMAEDAKRVSNERFEAVYKALADRVEKLEEAPNKMVSWISMGVSTLLAAGTIVYYLLSRH